MSEQGSTERMVRILEQMLDNQKVQLARQAEALELQRETFTLIRKQADRTERIQDRAEHIQAKSAQLVGAGRKVMAVVLPLVLVLVVYLSWLLFAKPYR
jgi:uncharacterized membrane protein (DUF106 family)